jgi:hypothetical protein
LWVPRLRRLRLPGRRLLLWLLLLLRLLLLRLLWL